MARNYSLRFHTLAARFSFSMSFLFFALFLSCVFRSFSSPLDRPYYLYNNLDALESQQLLLVDFDEFHTAVIRTSPVFFLIDTSPYQGVTDLDFKLILNMGTVITTFVMIYIGKIEFAGVIVLLSSLNLLLTLVCRTCLNQEVFPSNSEEDLQ